MWILYPIVHHLKGWGKILHCSRGRSSPTFSYKGFRNYMEGKNHSLWTETIFNWILLLTLKSSLHQKVTTRSTASNCEALGHSEDKVTSSSFSSSVFLWWGMFSRSAMLSGRAEKHQRAANSEEMSHERLPRSGKQSDVHQKSGVSSEMP